MVRNGMNWDHLDLFSSRAHPHPQPLPASRRVCTHTHVTSLRKGKKSGESICPKGIRLGFWHWPQSRGFGCLLLLFLLLPLDRRGPGWHWIDRRKDFCRNTHTHTNSCLSCSLFFPPLPFSARSPAVAAAKQLKQQQLRAARTFLSLFLFWLANLSVCLSVRRTRDPHSSRAPPPFTKVAPQSGCFEKTVLLINHLFRLGEKTESKPLSSRFSLTCVRVCVSATFFWDRLNSFRPKWWSWWEKGSKS